MKKAKIPGDVIDLIKCWLTNRSAYVECEGNSSYFFKITRGTVQGSVLGPILFAIFIAPLLNLYNSTMFADDNYIIESANNPEDLKTKIQHNVTQIHKWLRDSGMAVNLAKTEFIIFSPKKENLKLEINVNENNFSAKPHIKVLGVWFDNRFTWSKHIEYAISKLHKVNFGIRRLRTIFEPETLIGIATSLGFSTLYYGAAVWLSKNLHKSNLQNLLRASTNTLKSCFRYGDWNFISFRDIHEITNKATPIMYSNYVQATTLKNIMDHGKPNLVWTKLQFNCRMMNRDQRLYFGNESKGPSGLQNFANRILHASSKLPPGWQSMSKLTFKKIAKKTFLSF